MDSDYISYQKEDRIAFITLKNGRLSRQMINTLSEIWIDFENDNNLRVAILTGVGKFFSLGADLKQIYKNEYSFGELPKCIPGRGINLSKPVIAAVNGYAVGGGLALCAACDLRIASEKSTFMFPEAKIGIVLGGIDLFNHFDRSTILEMMLTGNPIDADKAFAAGFLNKVTPHEKMMEESVKYAEQIARNAPLSIKAIKAFALEHSKSMMDRSENFNELYINPQLESEDLQEGIKAFIEKRQPNFKGA